MTKKEFSFVLIILVLFSILSCTFEKDKNNSIANPEVLDSSQSIISDTFKSTSPVLTPLPFTGSPFLQNESKLLPQIDSITYIPLQTGFDFNFTQRATLNQLKTYSNQLPNIKEIEGYYSQFYCDHT